MPTITGKSVYSDLNGWRVQTNVWNPESLVYGTDYTIGTTYTAGNLASHPTYNWAFPALTQTNYYHVHAYPELMFGGSPWWGGAMSSDPLKVFPIKVNDLSNLTIKYDLAITGDTQGYNVAFEIFLTSVPNGTNTTMTNEIMVWFHKGAFGPGGTAVATYSDADFSGQIYTAANWTAGTDSTPWTYTAIVSNADDLSGKIDFTAMLAKLKSLGTITGNEYIAGLEFGAEVATGTGSLTFNALEYDVATGGLNTILGSTTGTSGADRLVGSDLVETLSGGAGNDLLYGYAGNDSLRGGAGTNTLDGGAGTDSALLAGKPADYFVSGNTVIGAGETDTLTNMEQAVFDGSGQTLTLAQFQAQAMTSLKVLEYVASYGDLIGAFGDDPLKGTEHWITNGYREGRNIHFSALNYIASYSDLIKAFGDDQVKGVEHYITSGWKEGRDTHFDPLNYIASYSDLIKAFGNNPVAGAEHFINTGYAEGRFAKFDAMSYIASYSDLIEAFGTDTVKAENHYIGSGYWEGRAISYDPVAYLISNPDLGALGYTPGDVTLQYIAHGYKEGRQESGGFGLEQTNHILPMNYKTWDTIGKDGDRDWFNVNLTAGQAYTFTLSGADGGNGTLATPFLSLYDAHGLLLTSVDGAGHDAKITFTASTSGNFYVVAAASDAGTGTYTLFGATGG